MFQVDKVDIVEIAAGCSILIWVCSFFPEKQLASSSP